MSTVHLLNATTVVTNDGGYTPTGGTIIGVLNDGNTATYDSGTSNNFFVLGFQSYLLGTNERVDQISMVLKIAGGPLGAVRTVSQKWGNSGLGWHAEESIDVSVISSWRSARYRTWPDGTEVNQLKLDGLQMAFHSTNVGPGSPTTGALIEATAWLYTVARPTVVVTGPVGTNPGNTHFPTVAWTATFDDGFPQKAYQVKIFDRAVNPNPAWTDPNPFYDSGRNASVATSFIMPKSVPNGSYRTLVQVAEDYLATDWWSLPGQSDFTINAIPPTPTAVGPTGTITSSHPNLVATLAMSAFAGSTNVRGRWQIATDAGFAQNPFTFDEPAATANSGGIHSYQVNELRLAERTWFLRAAAVDTTGTASAWSAPVQFVISHPMTATNRTPNGGILPLGNVNFAWTAVTAEPTSTQSAYQIVVQTQAGAAVADTGKVAGNPGKVAQATVNIPNANLLQWQIRLWDDEDIAGPYSTFQNFQVQDVPRVDITAPSNPFADSQPTVSWNFSASGGRTQASWRLVVTDDLHANVILYDTGIVADNATSHDLSDKPNVLINHGQYTFTVYVVDNTNFAGQGSAAGLKLVLPAPDPVTGVTVAVVPLDNQANLFGISGIATIDYAALTWNPTAQGATFGYYEVQRLTQRSDFTTLETFSPIAHITDETVTFFNDFECARTADGSVTSIYQVLVYDTIRGLSGASITPAVRVITDNSCDICLTSNYTPDLSVAYQDHAPYDFVTGDTALVRSHRIVGRRKPQMFRAANSDGDVFTRQLVLGANKVSDATDAEIGRVVFEPLLSRVRDTLAPYVCVTDGMGRRWYCGAKFQKGHFEAQWANYTADVEFTEVADFPTIVVALSPWQTP